MIPGGKAIERCRGQGRSTGRASTPAGQVAGPVIHESAALERVRAPVGCLDPDADLAACSRSGYRVVSILQPCLSRPLAICGLLIFEGLISEDAQPRADVEVPLGAEELEPLTGFGRDADSTRCNMKTHNNT